MKGDEAAAERYAQAIFELAGAGGQYEKLSTDLAGFAAAFSASVELREALENPVISEERKEAILRDLASSLSVDSLIARSVLVLQRRGRIGALSGLAKSFRALADRALGIERAEVTTASVMNESFYQGLEAGLSRSYGKRVVLERKTDPALIGGAVLRAFGQTMDHSVQSHLARLERELLSAALGARA